MKLKNLFILNAIIALLFGLGFIIAPEALASLYGVASDPSTMLMARFFGAALLGFAFLCWFARDLTDPAALSAIMRALLISHTVGLLVTISGIVSGVFNSFAWSVVIIYLILVLGFAYFLFIKKPADTQ